MSLRSKPTLSAALAVLALAAMPAAALASDQSCFNNPDCDDGQGDQPVAAAVVAAPPAPADTPAPAPADTPAPVDTPAPAPAPAPAPTFATPRQTVSAPASPSTPVTHVTHTPRHHQVKHHTVRVKHASLKPVALTTVPQGGVQAGEGGTAPDGPDALLIALAGGSALLLAGGGGLVARARRQDS